MHGVNKLNGCWKAYDERKTQNGQDPNCFSPEELWEFDFLVSLIHHDKPHLDQLTVILAVRDGMRRTIAPRPRQHFVELVMNSIRERELKWSSLLQNMHNTENLQSASIRYPFIAN